MSATFRRSPTLAAQALVAGLITPLATPAFAGWRFIRSMSLKNGDVAVLRACSELGGEHRQPPHGSLSGADVIPVQVTYLEIDLTVLIQNLRHGQSQQGALRSR
jgi:hypothetical protein